VMIGVFLVGAFPSFSLTSQNTDNKILVAVTILPEAEFEEKISDSLRLE